MFRVPPSGLNPAATASASTSVDFPEPFSPTRKVARGLSTSVPRRPTAGMQNGYSSEAPARTDTLRTNPARASPNGRRVLLGVDDRDEATLAARPVLDAAVAQGEDSVIAADAGAGARPEARATLPDEDHPRLDLLAAEDLRAEHLRVRVAP